MRIIDLQVRKCRAIVKLWSFIPFRAKSPYKVGPMENDESILCDSKQWTCTSTILQISSKILKQNMGNTLGITKKHFLTPHNHLTHIQIGQGNSQYQNLHHNRNQYTKTGKSEIQKYLQHTFTHTKHSNLNMHWPQFGTSLSPRVHP